MRRTSKKLGIKSAKSKNNCRCSACCTELEKKRKQIVRSATLEDLLVIVLLVLLTLPHAVYGIVDDTQQAAADSEQKTLTKQDGGASKDEALKFSANTFDHSEPHFKENRTGIVELFEWKFKDVAKECEDFLGPMGYAGVQLSPVTEHLRLANGLETWLLFYQPISYKFATRLGSIEDFMDMSRICNDAGVRVYVDVVLNHMVGLESEVGLLTNETLFEGIAGSLANVSALDYAEAQFTALEFHKACPLENYLDAHEVRNCQLNGQPDLDQSKAVVRERIVTLLNALVDLGVAGFRIDAAKYMWPTDLKAIYAAVSTLNNEEFDFPEDSRPFFYQEVVDLGMDAVSKTEYAGYGLVTEYLYAAELSTIFAGKVPLSTLINWGPAMGFLPHQDALVFVDTHESQHGYLKRELGQNQLLSYRQQRQHVMATVFMLAHPYGRIKRIMSSYYTNENDTSNGPPLETVTTAVDEVDADADTVDGANGVAAESEIIRSPEFEATNRQCIADSGWVCEHRWPPIVNMLTLANDLSPTEDGVINFQTFGPNHIAFCRGQKAFIAFNNDAVLDYETKVHTCLEPGIYCDVISGGLNVDGNDCLGKRIVVSELGMADLLLSALSDDIDAETGDAIDYGVIAIHIGSKLLNADIDEQAVLNEDIEVTDSNSTVTEATDDQQNEAEVETTKEEKIKLDKR